MRINTNMAALNAWRSMSTNQTNLQKSLSRLSSGYRINSAADDAAGLAVSEKMKSQIRGLNMATRNAQDAVSLVQTAEGGAGKIQDMLQRMRELAVQSSSGSLQDSDRGQLDTEFKALADEITRTTTSTTFNGIALLGGGTKSADVAGASVTTSNVTSNASLGSVKVDIATLATAATDSKDLVGNITAVTLDKSDGSDSGFALKIGANTYKVTAGTSFETAAATLVKQINDDNDGVFASYDGGTKKMTFYNTTAGAVTVKQYFYNGTTANTQNDIFTDNGAAGVLTVAAGATGVSDDLSVDGNAFTNNAAATSGYKLMVRFDADAGTVNPGVVAFEAAAGSSFSAQDIVNYINNNTSVNTEIRASLVGGKLQIDDLNTGANKKFELFETYSDGSTAYGGTTSYGWTAGAGKAGTDLTGTVTIGSGAPAAIAPNTHSNSYTVSLAAGSFDITATGLGESTVTVQDTQKMNIQVGANSGETIDIAVGATTNTALGISGLSIATISAMDIGGSGDVLNALDTAVSYVSGIRAKMGAYQNRMESAIDNLQTMSENLTAANSRIRDVDMAQEMANFTKFQVLSQASTAMLAQANQLSQGILSLLR